MKNLFQEITLEWLIVHIRDVHNYFQSNEMDDAMWNSVLVGQHVNVYKLTQKPPEHLEEAKDVADFWSWRNELIWLIVGELHYRHSISNLWIEQKM